MSTARKRMFGIGAIALGALLIFLGVTKPNPLAEKHSYWAEFDTVQGLGPIDRDVRIAGVKVGQVGAVEREGDDVRVELVLAEDFSVHDDARADMRPHTLFEGSNFIDLSPGSPSAPVVEEGALIPIERTSNYVTLDEALRILKPEIRTSLRDLTEVGSNVLRGEAIEAIQHTLKGAPGLTEDLAPAARAAQGPEREELANAVLGISQTVDAVADKEAELIPLLQRLNRTGAALTVEGGAPLDQALAALPGALQELHDAAPPLEAVIRNLDSLAVEITPALPELTAALRDTTPVLAHAIPVLRAATPLIEDTRLIAKRLGEAKGGLVTMFNLIDVPLTQFADLLAVLNAPSALGAPNNRQLIAGAFVGGDGVFSGYQTPSQNPDAPGHHLRIGTYFNPAVVAGLGDLLGGLPLPLAAQQSASCADVKQVSPSAARQVKAYGGCE